VAVSPSAARLQVLPLDAAAYAPSPLHAQDRTWLEKNCYADLWIELLHARGLEPLACMGFTLAVDFEGDQWTFFKPSHDDLRSMYGADVQELTVWRPLLDHVREHAAAGKWVCPEVDAHWLPDTAGTDYRQAHSKTMIAINDLDEGRRRLGYFHNAGYCTLEGEDFDQIFRADVPLPPYCEVVRLDRVVERPLADLRAAARAALPAHLARRPADNPVRRFAARFERDLPGLQAAGLTTYHKWAFATVRQLGAAFELAAAHLAWLGLAPEAVEAFERIAAESKALILKGARAVNTGKPLDVAAALAETAAAWERGMAATQAALA
jgi:hypothetical protein